MYKTLDLFKFLMSYLVVAIHVSCISVKSSYLFLDLFWSFAVPFFFITSGFFIYKGYKKEGIEKIDSYLIKSIRLYLLYTIIYLPITIIGFYFDDYPAWMNLLLFVRNVLFVGENFYSWPLWYLLGLIVAVIILRVLLYYRVNIYIIFALGILSTISGQILNYLLSSKTGSFVDHLVYLYHLVFVTTRNGLFIGFGYVSIGFLLAYLEQYLHKYLKLSYLILIMSYCLYLYEIPLSLNITSSILFIILTQTSIYNGSHSILLRKMSVLIYFFHMYFVFILGGFAYFTNIQFSFAQAYVIVLVLTTIFSGLIIVLSKKLTFLNRLLG